ncbi:MAG: helix-turn-helix domain-containing protein [Candidatus Omnitrophica bacterium]|nr:helix-turn-helix domain-containing protein [Candidatus Omnitrophota bacterium]
MAEKLITIREASEILGILEKDVIDLAKKKRIPSYLIGGEFLRFPREDIHQLKEKIQKEFNVLTTTVSFGEKVYNLFHFNDFYIISFLAIAILLGVILFT